ncbi:MAG: caspase family protein [Candidatus Aminicenantes bacterium]|nr:MAG: caspase family protein [Candidatus Aminicenantes bacterium]
MDEMEKEGLIAVIVGIDGYKKKPLHCAVNDAVYFMETLQKVWKDHKTIIKPLIWPHINYIQEKNAKEKWGIEVPKDAHEVTRESILSEVQKCIDLVRPSDTFIFYFSGHGALTDKEPALVTVGDGKTAEGVEYIKIREIQEAAARCPSQKKVMILDCCQISTKKYKMVERYKNMKDLTQGWSIFLSSGPGEISLEDQYFGDSRDDYLQQGVFTATLVAGLRGDAVGSSGSVTLADLACFVCKRVPIEYQERIGVLFTIRGDQNWIGTRGKGFTTQNPVLLSDAFAMGGSYQIIMAPAYVPTYQKVRRKMPGKYFINNWFKFLFGKWPIVFPNKLGFRLGAFLYTVTMMLTLLWHSPKTIDNNMLTFFIGVGLGSVFIWWSTLPFAVAANEDRWRPGGFLTAIFYLVWHCIVALGFAWICGIEFPSINQEPNRFIYLITDLFFIFATVMIYGCNASQAIIALAETIRPDERHDIRQAIRAFQQFKYKMLGVDLYNFVPMIPVRPDLYLYIGAISIAIVGFNIYQVMIAADAMTLRLWVFLMRNIFAMILVTWLVLWYQSAFKFIQREVYKR